jgi:hypothetical protein
MLSLASPRLALRSALPFLDSPCSAFSALLRFLVWLLTLLSSFWLWHFSGSGSALFCLAFWSSSACFGPTWLLHSATWFGSALRIIVIILFLISYLLLQLLYLLYYIVVYCCSCSIRSRSRNNHIIVVLVLVFVLVLVLV